MGNALTRLGALALAAVLLVPVGAVAHDGHDHDQTGDDTQAGQAGQDRPGRPSLAAADTAPPAVARAAAVSRTFPGAVLPPDFRDEVVVQGLDQPTAAEQAPDGRLFVLEKAGRLLVLDGLQDRSPTVALDIQRQVHNWYDRGALGFTVDPDFARNRFVYLFYAFDHRLGDDPGRVPTWGDPADPYYDACPGEQDTGCEISNRIVRYTMQGDTATAPKVLVEDWCQQFGSHSAGALEFDAAGYLYASGGEGANYDRVDWGQFEVGGKDPCGDPANQGGRLRSQDVRTGGDPTGLAGSVIRIDPATGQGAPGNPRARSSSPNERRLVAYGFRNPFRIALRPGTSDLYVGDVGEGTAEEIDRVGAGRSSLPNFGWPCFEGRRRYDLDKPLCTSLAAGQVRTPLFQYSRNQDVVRGERCKQGTASTSALSFVESRRYPQLYRGALAFGDFARDCIWFLPAGADGTPDASRPRLLVGRAGNPVDLFTGNDGDLYYVDIAIDETGQRADGGGKIHRITYQPKRPVARIVARVGGEARDPVYGPAGMTVNFDATTSSDPDGDRLTYEWDLDDDGTFDYTGPEVGPSYDEARDYTARLRVTDPGGSSDEATIKISAGNFPPSVDVAAPAASLRWSVGEVVDFAGSATDPDDGALPASALDWSVTMSHCPGQCHSHPVYGFDGQDSGSFVAIDHELPSRLVVTLTATDSRGLSTSVQRTIEPREVRATFGTSPRGLAYRLENALARGARSARVIAGEELALATARRQRLDGRLFAFRSWSTVRAGVAEPTVVVPDADAVSYVARFVAVKRTVRVRTSVPGLRVVVAGKRRAPFTQTYQVGVRLPVAAPVEQRLRGRRYVFVRWSDGGRARHRYVVPDKNTTLTAVYRRG